MVSRHHKNPTEMLDIRASSRGATVKLHRNAERTGQQSGDDGKIGKESHHACGGFSVF